MFKLLFYYFCNETGVFFICTFVSREGLAHEMYNEQSRKGFFLLFAQSHKGSKRNNLRQ